MKRPNKTDLDKIRDMRKNCVEKYRRLIWIKDMDKQGIDVSSFIEDSSKVLLQIQMEKSRIAKMEMKRPNKKIILSRETLEKGVRDAEKKFMKKPRKFKSRIGKIELIQEKGKSL